jgi:hypothetical protein
LFSVIVLIVSSRFFYLYSKSPSFIKIYYGLIGILIVISLGYLKIAKFSIIAIAVLFILTYGNYILFHSDQFLYIAAIEEENTNIEENSEIQA